MRILIIHNRYQQFGGEDAVVEEEIRCLRGNGHDVRLLSADNDGIVSIVDKLIAMILVVFNPFSYFMVRRFVKQWRPDVAHVHNFFPRLSPSIFYALSRDKIPTIFTAHNFRIMCPTATLYFQGSVTDRSLSNSSWWTVSKKTYHGSFFGTLSLAFMVELHKLLGTWRHKVTTIIALTDFARDKFVAGGILRNHIEVKGNSSREITTCTDECAKYGAVFVGRLTAEKGLSTLLDAWEGVSYPLTIIGDGPMSDDSRLNTISNVYYIGKLPRQEVAEHIRRSAFLILPSEWYEMFPMIIPEAYSTSTPIIAAKIGGLSTLIKPGVTGLHFEPGNASSLKEKVRWAIENAEEMRRFGALARIAYEAEYTAQHNYDNLMTIYRGAIAQKR